MANHEHYELEPTAKQLAARVDGFQSITMKWCETLNTQPEYENFEFFELGGTSVAGARLLVQLSSEFGLRIPLDELYKHRTLNEFRARIIELIAES